MIVCSRIKDYEALSQRLTVQRAIYLRSLLPAQVDDYLNRLNAKLAGLRQLLLNDAIWQELARSPLILNIMVLAYEGIDPQNFPEHSIETHRQQLFNTYIERMLKRRGVETHYSNAQTIRWLSWLAQQLVRSSQTIFLIEWIDRSWLQNRQQRWMYILLSPLLVSLILGSIIAFSVRFKPNWFDIGLTFWAIYSLTIGLFAWVVIHVEQLPHYALKPHLQKIVTSLWTGLAAGVLLGFVAGIDHPPTGWIIGVSLGTIIGLLDWMMNGIIGLTYLKPVEALRWSWPSIGRSLIFHVVASSILGLLFGAFRVFDINFTHWLIISLFSGLPMGLFMGLRADAEIETHRIPNQGILHSARTAGTVTLILVLITSILMSYIEVVPDIVSSWGTLYGLFVGFLMGGAACVVHICLRIVFYCHGYIPWNYAHFLDYAVDRVFLQKVGGGYIFIHRLLMEHFAAMPVKEKDEGRSLP